MKRLAVAGVASLAAAVVLRLPALGQPLDRDSALYAAIGQRLDLHTLPYRDLFDHKQPLIHWVYGALDLLAPGRLAAIRLAAAVPSALVAAGLFVGLQPIVGRPRAALAAALAIVVSASTTLQGTDLNTEHLLGLPAAVTILWALSLGRDGVRGGAFVIGVVGGIAILAKATGALTTVVALIPLLATRRSREQSALETVVRFGLGVALPVGLVVAAYAVAGAAGDLVFANLTYNSRYVEAEGFSLAPGGPEAMKLLVAAALCCGLVRLASHRWRDVIGWSLVAWLLAAWIGAQTSSRGFPHYYAPLVAPAAALLVLPQGPASRAAALARSGALAVGALAAVLLAVPVATNFGRSGDEIFERAYGAQDLALTRTANVVGPFLRRRQAGRGELFVTGSEPEYYWRSGLPNANRWLFDYPAEVAPERFEPDVAGLCRDGPRFVVVSGGMPAYASRCTEANGYREILRSGPAVVLERSGP